ncbi:MAG: hypothetical protein MJA84_12130 [Firmicutes bacterium]|nr:hypothetical protein [Bacillota bacterium]
MVTVLLILAVTLVALRVASYGWYAWKEENNRRGAAGAFITAVVTLLAPLLLMWYYAYFA